MGHSPSPWKLTSLPGRSVFGLQVVDADKKPVVSFGNQARWQPTEKWLANARLITQAPAFLDVCEDALVLLVDYPELSKLYDRMSTIVENAKP